MQRYVFNCLLHKNKIKFCLTVRQQPEQEMNQVIIIYRKNIEIFVFFSKRDNTRIYFAQIAQALHSVAASLCLRCYQVFQMWQCVSERESQPIPNPCFQLLKPQNLYLWCRHFSCFICSQSTTFLKIRQNLNSSSQVCVYWKKWHLSSCKD